MIVYSPSKQIPVYEFISSPWPLIRIIKGKKVKFSLEQDIKTHMGREVLLHFSLTSALDEGGWSMPRPGLFTPGGRPGTHCTRGWAGWAPGPGWTRTENLAPTRFRFPDRPARSESLYRLSYPGSSPMYPAIHYLINHNSMLYNLTLQLGPRCTVRTFNSWHVAGLRAFTSAFKDNIVDEIRNYQQNWLQQVYEMENNRLQRKCTTVPTA